MALIAQGSVKLEMDDGRFSILKQQLETFKPHVLFLSGHGTFHHQPHTGEEPYGAFVFESEDDNSSRHIHEIDIAKAFIGSRDAVRGTVRL